MDDFKIQGNVGGHATDEREEFAVNSESAPPPWSTKHPSASSTVDGWRTKPGRTHHTDSPPPALARIIGKKSR